MVEWNKRSEYMGKGLVGNKTLGFLGFGNIGG